MPGRTREGARVSKLYKLKMQGKLLDKPKDKTEKKVDSDKKEDTKLDRVKKIFKDEEKKST